ncbi:hypothetical protein AB0J14_17610 [Micromonospora arborensis]|uniref:hypothetical protein n=1 Tax=Micromonospora arborensis TaxID=2116518 RepID=UPI0033CEF8C0
MPYPQERASRIAHVPTVMSPAVSDALKRWVTPSVDPPKERPHITDRCMPIESLATDQRPEPNYAIAFDGSNQEVEARAGYPSVRVGFLQIAGVYVDIPRFLNANSTGLVNARELERSQKTQTVNSVLPGSGVHIEGMTGKASWRMELARSFTDAGIDDFGTKFTLADALMTIHGTLGHPATSISLAKCATCGSGGAPVQLVTTAGGNCSDAKCGARMELTDVLRLYEEFAEEGENILPLTRAMNIAERLLLISYLDGFYKASPVSLARGIFITDGPLAVYGPIAPMKTRFREYWEALCAELEARDTAPPLIVGIEKTGRFVDHARAIQQFVPEGNVMMLDTPYINRYITNQSEAHFYGKDEFYGRRFIYRTRTGEVLVVTVPRVPGGPPYEKPEKGSDGKFLYKASEDFASYPTLRATLEVLDLMQTRLYPNAVIPVALAHSASSLPLGTGRSVLTLLAQQSLGVPQNSISLSRFKVQGPRHR